jgi:hypothetical protein
MVPSISACTQWHAHSSSLRRRSALDQARTVLQTTNIVSDDCETVPCISELRCPVVLIVSEIGPGVRSLNTLAIVFYAGTRGSYLGIIGHQLIALQAVRCCAILGLLVEFRVVH